LNNIKILIFLTELEPVAIQEFDVLYEASNEFTGIEEIVTTSGNPSEINSKGNGYKFDINLF
jgi:hypothetical protein